MGLYVKGARIGRRRREVDRLRMPRIANIGNREAVGKHVPDKGMALMHHDLHAVAAAVQIAMADKFDIARGVGCHGAGSQRAGVKRILTARDGKAKAKAAGSPHPPSAPPRAPSPRKRGEGYEAAMPGSLSPAAGRGLGCCRPAVSNERTRCKLREIAKWRIG